MADITITIPDDKLQLTLDSFAEHFGYDVHKLDENETQGQFAKRMLINKIRQIVKASQKRIQSKVVEDQVEIDVDNINYS